MAISGVVITLSRDSRAASAAIADLTERHEIEIGERHGNRLSIVLECQDKEHDSRTWEWMQALSGVEQAQLVFVDCDGGSTDG